MPKGKTIGTPVVGSIADTEVRLFDPRITDRVVGVMRFVPTTEFDGESNDGLDRFQSVPSQPREIEPKGAFRVPSCFIIEAKILMLDPAE